MKRTRATASTRVAFLGVLALCAAAQSRAADCNSPAKETLRYVNLPGHPFSTISSADGCWLFVSLSSSSPVEANGVAVLRRNGNGDIKLIRVVRVESSPSGMVLTHNGKMLIAADDEFVRFPGRAKDDERRQRCDPRGFLRDQRDSGSIYVNVTRDDKYAFVSDENAASITVIDLEKARTKGFDEKAIVGKIPTRRGADSADLFIRRKASLHDQRGRT